MKKCPYCYNKINDYQEIIIKQVETLKELNKNENKRNEE
jgi:hypothetical protein